MSRIKNWIIFAIVLLLMMSGIFCDVFAGHGEYKNKRWYQNIFDWDDVGREFADALKEAAERGAHVQVLVDGIGALKSFSRMGPWWSLFFSRSAFMLATVTFPFSLYSRS